MLVTILVTLLVSQLGDAQLENSTTSGRLGSTTFESQGPASPPAQVELCEGVAPTFSSQFEDVRQVPAHMLWSQTLPNETAPIIQAMGHSTSLSPVEASASIASESQFEELPLDAWQMESPILDSPINAARRPLRDRIAALLSRRIGCDLGIGHERVMYAPQVVETATGTSNTGLLIRADRGLSTPDRLEAIWAASSRGPSPETRVDILDTVFRMELGNSKLLVMTDYTMRSLNPERNDNTTGFGDMVLGTKATVLDGQSTQLSTVFRTYLKTGPADRGLGTGHVSLEPGLLLRHQLNQHTYFHGEAKYWLPIAGTPAVAGDVLKLGAALSTVWKETDRMALLPTLEFSSYTFLSGSATQPNGLSRRVNGEFAAELYPGLRVVHGPGGEFGLLEYGMATGFIFADQGWFDSRLIFNIRMVH